MRWHTPNTTGHRSSRETGPAVGSARQRHWRPANPRRRGVAALRMRSEQRELQRRFGGPAATAAGGGEPPRQQEKLAVAADAVLRTADDDDDTAIGRVGRPAQDAEQALAADVEYERLVAEILG